MSNKTTTIEQTEADAPAEWGDRGEIGALARRFQTMMPGNLGHQEALVLAQYSAALDANPFRGEVYAFEYKGRLVLTEGYKLLIRWARRQCNFSDRYERLSGDELPDGAIGFRCYILRDDAHDTLRMLIEAGATWQEAFEIAATSAVGIVRKAEMWSVRTNQPIDPPTGWTWEEVARKRALKNALNRAYGAPSPREIARETWMVNDTETVPQDWTECTPDMLPVERELRARYLAQERQRKPSPKSPAEDIEDLFGPTAR